MEKEDRKCYHEIEKENIIREEKMKELKEKRKGNEDFIRKFFPTSESSPGGTQRIVTRKPLDVSPTRGRGSGKSVSRRSDLFPAIQIIFLLILLLITRVQCFMKYFVIF